MSSSVTHDVRFLSESPASSLGDDVAGLTELLRRAGRLPDGGRVVAARATPVGGSGLVGAVVRLRLGYAPDGPPGPPSLALKTASAAFAEGPRLAEVEAEFYRHLAPRLPEPVVPQVLGSGGEAGDRPCWLLLEDLGDQGFVRQIDGCAAEQALAAVRKLAALHAPWWGRDLPAGAREITVPRDAAVTTFCARWLGSHTGAWPPVLGDAPQRLLAGFDRLATRLASAPRTLVHGDFHSQNIAFGAADRPRDVRFIDFQFAQHGCGPLDVARFLATSLTPRLRRTIETDLVREYHRALLARGVTGYDLDRCRHDVRAALPWNLATPLALHVMAIQQRGREWPARLPIVERCLAAIDDWDAWDVP
ncbi:phosphotransferase [Streptomyces buecherae]|uniref:phosphotransferase n=1 Tax=Streptomyces buecherae TaxID=2763006 RepID=UPI0036693DBF